MVLVDAAEMAGNDPVVEGNVPKMMIPTPAAKRQELEMTAPNGAQCEPQRHLVGNNYRMDVMSK